MFKVAIAACAALALVLVFQSVRLESVKADLDQRDRDVAALELERDQARLAREVAEAAMSRIQVKADEYDALREALLSGDQNADIPNWFSDWLFDLGVSVRPDD